MLTQEQQQLTAVVTSLVEDAVAAPSMHNAQPWRFVHHAGSGLLSLYGDPQRTLPVGDPDRRGLHLGCGAALLNLRVSAALHGWTADAELLPDPSDHLRLADVRLTESGTTDTVLADLHPAIARRHTSRFPFSDEPIPPELFDELCAAALLEGCRLIVPGTWHRDAVLDLVHDAELLESASAAMRAEIADWTRTGRTGEGPADDGIPSSAFGPRQYGVTAPARDFDAPRTVPDRTAAAFEERPQIALLGTATDTPADWLRAGQAMQRVLLEATLDGLSTSLMSQPLEWPELRPLTRDPGSTTGFVHMVLRLGYGPSGTATPRRPVADVLTVV
ncbi:nitroreductase family protein [Streptomyces sp. TRM75563]|uniref:Acg family FMN-binding oxidoreductase n=1 Tax=Streptomyces sp. TRM75563 TaxID=2817418 RepID=UPI001F60A549|nr:nitroreductase family protein [Streptomyces sp. TRM75563]MCI4042711.1 nitroreductase family protein [Streptomyces sp. TRM75563]